MDRNRRLAVATGVLFITATVADLLGAAVRPDLADTDYLTQVSAKVGAELA